MPSSLPPLTYSSLHRYNTNVNHPDYNESWFDKRMVGFEDMPTQAEWLLSLTEDLERHSSACQYGCAPEADRVCVGGSIMAWVDEWWKGRVIEATSFDTRTDTMGDLCPDLEANVHSPCGYPTLANGEDTGSQPDSYVNEEWFGLFHVSEPTCKSGGSWGLKVDKLKARDAWLRLKLLWARGSCLVFRDKDGGSLYNQPYNTTEYPRCGDEIARLRRSYRNCQVNASARADPMAGCTERALAWDGTDCVLMDEVAFDPSICPTVPSHMRPNRTFDWSINQTSLKSYPTGLYEEQTEWRDQPDVECDTAAEQFLAQYIGWIIAGALLFIALTIINYSRIKALVRESLPRFRLSFWSSCCAGRKTGQWAAELRRDLRRGRRGSAQSVRAGGETSTSRNPDDKMNDNALVWHAIRAIRRPPTLLNYLPLAARVERDRRVKEVLLPIAGNLAKIFGFQQIRLDETLNPGAPADAVPSNLNNSVDHLCALIGQRMDRLPRDPTEFEGADTFKADLRIAVEQAHHKLLATFFKWNEHVRLPDRVKARLRGKNNQVTVGSHKYTRRDFKTKGDVASQCVCNAQLHRSLLYLLIWGEVRSYASGTWRLTRLAP